MSERSHAVIGNDGPGVGGGIEGYAPLQPRGRLDARRRHVHDVAKVLIRERGFSAFSVNDLADQVNLSIGGLYRYIRTKSDLLVTACEGIYGDIGARMAQALEAAPDPVSALGAAFTLYLDACTAAREDILLLYREYRHLPIDAQERYKQRELAIAEIFERAIEAGIAQGRFRTVDPFVTAYDLVFLGHLPAMKSWALDRRLARGEITSTQVELVVKGLLANP